MANNSHDRGEKLNAIKRNLIELGYALATELTAKGPAHSFGHKVTIDPHREKVVVTASVRLEL